MHKKTSTTEVKTTHNLIKKLSLHSMSYSMTKLQLGPITVVPTMLYGYGYTIMVEREGPAGFSDRVRVRMRVIVSHGLRIATIYTKTAVSGKKAENKPD
jgi:hypothetical protein